MKYYIIVPDDVQKQLLALVELIEMERTGFGALLIESYNRAIYLLERYPRSHRARKGNWRIIKLNRFHYILVYKVGTTYTVFVRKIVHTRSGSRKKYRK
jgi:hypothetical protein